MRSGLALVFSLVLPVARPVVNPSRRATQPDRGGRGAIAPPRALLRDYALAWAERVLRGAVVRAAGEDDPLEVLVLDPFAGADHPLPPGEMPVPVEVLARVFAPAGREPSRARAFLLEEDPVKLDWLLAACGAAGLEGRTGRGGGSSEISLVEGAWDGAGSDLALPEGARAGIALLDPPGAGKLPLAPLLALLRRHPGMDLLLRFPVSDLRRLAGFRGIPLADLPPYARRSAEGLSRLLDDPRHGWAIPWSRTAGGEEGAAEAEVVERLAERLRGAGERHVRVFRVEAFAEADFLLLASPDPARLLLMNEVLLAARNEGRLPWPEDGEVVRHVPRAELELFAGPAGSPGPAAEARDRTVDLTSVAHSLALRFAGRRATLRRVLESVVASDLFEEDVRAALRELRRDGRALYRSLAQPEAEIAFPRQGDARARPAGRGRRRGGGEELSLALDPDDD